MHLLCYVHDKDNFIKLDKLYIKKSIPNIRKNGFGMLTLNSKNYFLSEDDGQWSISWELKDADDCNKLMGVIRKSRPKFGIYDVEFNSRKMKFDQSYLDSIYYLLHIGADCI